MDFPPLFLAPQAGTASIFHPIKLNIMLPNPVIFGTEINWYSAFHYLGLMLSILIGIAYARKKYNGQFLTRDVLILIPATIFVMLIGSRVAGMAEAYVMSGQWPDYRLLFLGPSKGKFRWCGSVAAVFIFIPLLGKLFRIKNYRNYLDVLVISLCVLTAITKQGCLFSGDGCYGIATTLPWGMYFPYGAAPNLLPVHPTPIYDSIFHLLLCGLLLWQDNRKTSAGQTALLYFLLAPAFYIILELIRLNPKTSLGITVPQLTYLVVFLGATLWWAQLFFHSNKWIRA